MDFARVKPDGAPGARKAHDSFPAGHLLTNTVCAPMHSSFNTDMACAPGVLPLT